MGGRGTHAKNRRATTADVGSNERPHHPAARFKRPTQTRCTVEWEAQKRFRGCLGMSRALRIECWCAWLEDLAGFSMVRP